MDVQFLGLSYPLSSSKELLSTLQDNTALLIEKRHNQINTTLDLTEVVPFTLMYFKKTDEPKEYALDGVGFSLNTKIAPFQISTQADLVLLVKHESEFPFKEVIGLQLKSEL